MPRIPIIRPPKESVGPEAGDGRNALPPEQVVGLRTLEARTARIDRELAVSQSWLAGLSRLAAAEDAPEGPPTGFMRQFLEEADRERALVLKPLPLDRQGSLAQDLMALRQGFAERAAAVEAEGMALRRRLALHRTLEGYRSGVARNPSLYDDAAGRMQALVADLGLPEERRNALDLHLRDALGNAAVDGLMNEPGRAERLLSTGLYDDALTEASKASRLKEAQSLVARNGLLVRERTLSALTAEAGEGVASDDAIAAALQDGILSAAEAEHLRARTLEVAQATELRQARIQRIASAAALDPSDPEEKAAVNAYWEEVSEVYASDDAEAQRKAELAFVQRFGVLPDGLKRKYQGALLSADSAIAVSGAMAIDELIRLNPALVADIPIDQRKHAIAIAEYAAFDLPPARAVELANRDVEQSDTAPDATATAPANAVGDPTESASDERIDGVAVVVDPDSGERTTVDAEAVKRLEALAANHEALIGLHETYLDLYDGVASGEITREEATRLLLDHIKETLPSENEAGSPLSTNLRLRQTLQRLATDIFDARDRADAAKLFADGFTTTASIQEIGEFMLSIAPVTGEFISANDAYHGFLAAIEASRRGDDDAMLREGAWATLAAVGALPLIGYLPRLGRAGRKAFVITRQLTRRAIRRGQRFDDLEPTQSIKPVHANPRPAEGRGIVGQMDVTDPGSTSRPYKSGRLVLDQGPEQTCGITCAAMVLDSLGKPFDIKKLRRLSRTGEAGVDIENLEWPIRASGVKDARHVQDITEEQLAAQIDEARPAIAGIIVLGNPRASALHEKFALHAIVVDRIVLDPKNLETGGEVFIRDPAGGREYVAPVNDLKERFTGHAIVIKRRK